ncbi:Pls/PosA family non-ribosomal peptide synthetase [Pseudonocardia spirodelae]|uniref:Pls/PosA family non-ribosomal peptide synthetase n=1 Tax=Pseudonocardia spirodelae TaxID=3133431 RepID=A0ABU8T0Q4_9PSEU
MSAAFEAILTDLLDAPIGPEDHFFVDAGADSMLLARFCARVRQRPDLPHVAMTDVYAHPTVAGLAAALAPAPAGAGRGVAAVREGYRAILADLLDAEVPGDADVFADLGADSMTMTRFCARVRRREDLPDVAMTDVYAHPTAAALAVALAGAPVPPSAPPVTVEPVPPASTRAYVLCGAAQLLTFVTFVLAYGTVLGYAYLWIAQGSGLVAVYLRSLAAVTLAFTVFAVLPIAAKWLLVGRWTEREIPLWSAAYFRFWLARTLVRTNPLLLVAAGSPLLPLYLRLLGARIGPGVVMLSRIVPACPDLLTVGAHTVLRKDSVITGYRAEPGLIRTGRVSIGERVVVGEATVIDIGATIGDGARLAHSSSLHAGQTVPAGATWWGTPARPGGGDPGAGVSAPCGRLRRAGYALGQLGWLLLVWLPLGYGVADAMLVRVPTLASVLGPDVADITSPQLWVDAAVTAAGLLVAGLAVGLLGAAVVARVLSRGLVEGRPYPLYGFRYTLQRTVFRITNIKFFTYLAGDSSYIVDYLRMIGHDLRRTPQTGTNFGTAVKQETPFASSIGTGTMVADGLSIINVDYSDTAFVVNRTRIGANSFFGNRIAYPAGSRAGDDCLIATKTHVPTDGPVRTGVGLLGSPPFEIPRTVARDATFGHLHTGLDLHDRLRAKNRYNRHTIALALLVRWGSLFGITLLTLVVAELLVPLGPVALGVQLLVSLLFTMVYSIAVERLSVAGRRRLRPRFCSVYDPYFWWHERYWKLVVQGWDRMLAGTPFKNVVTRALGVDIGRRVFDDGCGMTDRTLVRIGDDVVLNAGSTLQCHSQEDGTFKSGHITVGSGACLDVGAFVHYGAVLGDAARVGCDAFLMKGEEVPAGAFWEGNPARAAERPAPVPTPLLNGETAR